MDRIGDLPATFSHLLLSRVPSSADWNRSGVILTRLNTIATPLSDSFGQRWRAKAMSSIMFLSLGWIVTFSKTNNISSAAGKNQQDSHLLGESSKVKKKAKNVWVHIASPLPTRANHRSLSLSKKKHRHRGYWPTRIDYSSASSSFRTSDSLSPLLPHHQSICFLVRHPQTNPSSLDCRQWNRNDKKKKIHSRQGVPYSVGFLSVAVLLPKARGSNRLLPRFEFTFPPKESANSCQIQLKI